MKNLKTKLFILLIALITVIAVSTICASATDLKIGIGIVDASGLRLRSGPDTSYSSLSVIGANEAVTVLDVAENGWYKVRRASGQEGWASNKYIKLQ